MESKARADLQPTASAICALSTPGNATHACARSLGGAFGLMSPEGGTCASYPFVIDGAGSAIEGNFVGTEGCLEVGGWVVRGENFVARCKRDRGGEGAYEVPAMRAAVDSPYGVRLGRGDEPGDRPPTSTGDKPGGRGGFSVEHRQRGLGRCRTEGDGSLYQLMSSAGAGAGTGDGGRGAKPVVRKVGSTAGGAGRRISVPSSNLVSGRFGAEVHVIGVRVGVSVVVLVIWSAGAGQCTEDLCSGLGCGELRASK